MAANLYALSRLAQAALLSFGCATFALPAKAQSTPPPSAEADEGVVESATARPPVNQSEPSAATPPLPPYTPSTEAKAAAEPDPKLELSALVGFVSRAADATNVRYQPGTAWAGQARVALTNWLGVALMGGKERHQVWLGEGSLGLPDPLTQPALDGLRVGGSVSLRHRLRPRLYAEIAAGVAWSHYTAAPLQNRARTLVVPERTGVVVTLPVSPRALFVLVPGRLALSAVGTVGFALPGQTGELFARDGGGAQAVRQDTGELVSVGGLPPFTHSYGGYLSVDLLL